MAIFSFSKKQHFFSASEIEQIIESIRLAEKQTSGEIRVYVESKNPFVNPVDRAAEIFHKLKMENTSQRNAVLLYIAMKHKELALFGDEGIYKRAGNFFWDDAVNDIITHFLKKDMCSGIVNCITQIGYTLKEKFPYNSATNKNELPDEIVFGK